MGGGKSKIRLGLILFIYLFLALNLDNKSGISKASVSDLCIDVLNFSQFTSGYLNATNVIKIPCEQCYGKRILLL